MTRTRVPGEITAARERVESRGFAIMDRDPTLARLVTAADTRREPFHRWMVFKQAFSPEMVRRFLREGFHQQLSRGSAPLLDPFSGIGTLVTECARQNVAAAGVDSLLSTAFVCNMKSATEIPDLPELTDCVTWEEAADRMIDPVHRAALICAVAGRLTGKGAPNKNAPGVLESLDACLAMMRADVLHPLPRRNMIVHGDGRDLSFIADRSTSGILTSPPYLSRHDYRKLTREQEAVYAHWYGSSATRELAASPTDSRLNADSSPSTSSLPAPLPEAVDEACNALVLASQEKLARLVHSYFHGLLNAVSEFRRVLSHDAPCWIVIGGARLKDVYVPTDTILAEWAAAIGFTVDRILVARDLIQGGRKFGRLTNIAPRESILVMRRK